MRVVSIKRPLAERLMDKVEIDPNSGCWLWSGSTIRNGYGEINRGRNGEGKVLAHRASYEIHVGLIPAGLDLDHKCRTRSCVNPLHLEPVTRQENLLRGVGPEKMRARFATMTHCKNGHEFTPENTRWGMQHSGKHRQRTCRACAREWARKKYAAKCPRAA